VVTYTLGVTLRALSPWDDATAAPVVDALGDDGAVWVDPADPALLRISAERTADEPAAALAQGRALADQLRDRAPVPAGVLEVSAMDDDDVMVWRAEAS
jgi:hypothetical protein